MRSLPLIALVVSLLVPAYAVRTGDTLASVLAEKGPPASRLEHGNVIVLSYGNTVVRLESGVVVSVTMPPADYATQAAPVKPVARTGGRSAGGIGTNGEWTTDLDTALASAAGRKVFLFFTGSDWCGWCKRLEGEILGTPEFRDFAREGLVLVKLDFPRRIEQTAELKAQNSRLAQKYGIEGYPTVVVLDQTGKEIGRTGYQRGGPGPVIESLRKM